MDGRPRVRLDTRPAQRKRSEKTRAEPHKLIQERRQRGPFQTPPTDYAHVLCIGPDMAGLTRQHPPRRHMESHAQATLSPPHIRTPKHARPADLERPMSMHTHMRVHPADIWSSKRLRAAMHYMRANAPLAELHLNSAALSTSCMPHTASIRLQTTGTIWLSAAHISAAHATCNRALQKHASHSDTTHLWMALARRLALPWRCVRRTSRPYL